MRRTILSVALAVLLSTAAYAASVHFKPKGGPAFTDNGLTLTAVGTLAGLGNEDIAILLTAHGNPTATCTNPGSGTHQPPGQNPAAVTVAGSQAIPASEIQNGQVSI